MKILKSGKEKAFLARCAACSSDLEFCLDDVETETIELQSIKATEYCHSVTCPVCGAKIRVTLQTQEDFDRVKASNLYAPNLAIGRMEV